MRKKRTTLWASVAASAALAASVSLLPRAHDSSALEPSRVYAPVTTSAGDGQLVDPQVVRAWRDIPREGPEVEIEVHAADARAAGDDAVHALAQRLCGPDYRRVTFETEARARIACLPDGALAGEVASDPALAVARAVLMRVSSATLDERRAAARADLPQLREALLDERLPRAVAEQAAATLAALGDDADRARLFADATDPASPRAAQAVRIGLESLEGPGAGLALVEAAAAERADGSFLAVVPAWTQAHGSALAPAERSLCAESLLTIAGDATRDASARSRALSGLRALDPEQAAIASLAWLRDASADAALVRSACASVRAGHVDPPSVLALTREPALAVERRIEIACAFLGSAQAQDAEPSLVAQVRDTVHALGASDLVTAFVAREVDVSVRTPPVR